MGHRGTTYFRRQAFAATSIFLKAWDSQTAQFERGKPVGSSTPRCAVPRAISAKAFPESPPDDWFVIDYNGRFWISRRRLHFSLNEQMAPSCTSTASCDQQRWPAFDRGTERQRDAARRGHRVKVSYFQDQVTGWLDTECAGLGEEWRPSTWTNFCAAGTRLEIANRRW